jgi:hypothetical protein
VAACIFDLIIEQGSLYEALFSWTDDQDVPINLSGWSARMQIRSTVESNVVLVDLSTENEGILLTYNNPGTILIRLTTRQTNAFTWVTGVYDLELYSPQFESYRLIKGKVKIDPQVTRVPPMIIGVFNFTTGPVISLIS